LVFLWVGVVLGCCSCCGCCLCGGRGVGGLLGTGVVVVMVLLLLEGGEGWRLLLACGGVYLCRGRVGGVRGICEIGIDGEGGDAHVLMLLRGGCGVCVLGVERSAC